MKKLKLKLDGKEILSKDQMKAVKGGGTYMQCWYPQGGQEPCWIQSWQNWDCADVSKLVDECYYWCGSESLPNGICVNY